MPLWGDSKSKKRAGVLATESNDSNSTTNLVIANPSDRSNERSSKPYGNLPVLGQLILIKFRVAFQSDPTEGEYGLRILHNPASAVVE
jgi:hypothetical protein